MYTPRTRESQRSAVKADACLAVIARALLFDLACPRAVRFLSTSNPPCVSTAGRGFRFGLRLILTFEAALKDLWYLLGVLWG